MATGVLPSGSSQDDSIKSKRCVTILNLLRCGKNSINCIVKNDAYNVVEH